MSEVKELLAHRIENDFKHHAPTDDDIENYRIIRDTAKSFAHDISRMCPESRERSLALTKLEETVMWANASIARSQ